jgi:hypothetical protein
MSEYLLTICLGVVAAAPAVGAWAEYHFSDRWEWHLARERDVMQRWNGKVWEYRLHNDEEHKTLCDDNGE